MDQDIHGTVSVLPMMALRTCSGICTYCRTARRLYVVALRQVLLPGTLTSDPKDEFGFTLPKHGAEPWNYQ